MNADRRLILIEISGLYRGNARIGDLDEYIDRALFLAGQGNDVVLTGQGPIWLYLKMAHALHGVARRLIYRSPVAGDLVVFDHSPE